MLVPPVILERDYRSANYNKSKNRATYPYSAVCTQAQLDQHVAINKKLLFLEDNYLISALCMKWLAELECSVDWAMNCQQAMNYLAGARQNRYDLLIFDVNLPDGNGLELASYVRTNKKNFGNIPIMIHSTLDCHNEMREHCEALAIDAYFNKPGSCDAFKALVQSL